MKNFRMNGQEMKTTPNAALIKATKRIITLIVLHCTATSPDTSVEAIRKYWRNTLKWKQPGYHYLVKKNGETVQLASEDRIVNGVRGHNAHAIHLAYIGGTTTDGHGRQTAADTRTAAQRAALRSLVERLHRSFPKALILGHRDLSPDLNHNGRIEPGERIKACPCFDATDEYRDLNGPAKHA